MLIINVKKRGVEMKNNMLIIIGFALIISGSACSMECDQAKNRRIISSLTSLNTFKKELQLAQDEELGNTYILSAKAIAQWLNDDTKEPVQQVVDHFNQTLEYGDEKYENLNSHVLKLVKDGKKVTELSRIMEELNAYSRSYQASITRTTALLESAEKKYKSQKCCEKGTGIIVSLLALTALAEIIGYAVC